MRYFIILYFTCYFAIALCRPSRLEDLSDNSRDADQNEYEEEDQTNSEAADDYSREEQRADTQSLSSERREHNTDSNLNAPQKLQESRYVREQFSDASQTDDKEIADESNKGYNEVKTCNEYVGTGSDSNDQTEAGRMANRDVNKFDNSMGSDRDRKVTGGNDEVIFAKTNRYASVDEAEEPQNSEETRKSEDHRYYKSRQKLIPFTYKKNENIATEDSSYNNYNRDRRQASQASGSENTENVNTKVLANDDDEAVIKSHIKRLSNGELDELLNSLSEDKRALLRRIIDNDSTKDNAISKREITKKAGAIEDNSLIDSESIKSQSGNEPVDVTDSSSVTTETKDIKQPEIQTAISTTKSPESKEDAINDSKDKNSNLIAASVDGKPATTKVENKREATNDDYDTSLDSKDISDTNSNDLFNDHYVYCSSNDDDAHHDINSADANVYKRDLLSQSNDELAESMKSLEDSFPNGNAYDEADSNSDMAPLVRVKRKNTDETSNKLPILDTKSCASYRAENSDDDNEEGSEFEEDGFYDRTSSIDKTDHKAEGDTLTDSSSDASALGSDSDNVVMGIEGVDDNLMLNSRNRRALIKKQRDLTKSTKPETICNLEFRPTPSINVESERKQEMSMNSPVGYQESDAFGPVSHGHDGELARFKRIRRLRPSSTPEESSTT